VKLAAAAAAALAAAAAGFAAAPAQPPEPAAATAELVGRIDVQPPPGQRARLSDTVVWLPGVEGAVRAATPSMSSRNKRFDPHVLVVARGAEVTFPNVDPVYHNVFSLSPGNAFDLGLYRRGAKRTRRLEAPGLVRVYCNIHPDMAGYVLVVEGSAWALTGEDGRFRIAGLPPGRHPARIWSEYAGERELEVDLVAGRAATIELTLDATRYRRVQHLNKFGKKYPPVSKDADRY
jgi:plastocyanin